jgi:hypothetical protein
MFRARFSDAFPSKLINIGPQDIERGIVDSIPSPPVESLLCALLGLVLNRKKPVESVTPTFHLHFAPRIGLELLKLQVS